MTVLLQLCQATLFFSSLRYPFHHTMDSIKDIIDLATTVKFKESEWIGCGKVYDNGIPINVEEAKDCTFDIPMAYQDVLPSPEIPVAQLVGLQLPVLSLQFIMTKVNTWFSKEPADPGPNISLLCSHPIPNFPMQ